MTGQMLKVDGGWSWRPPGPNVVTFVRTVLGDIEPSALGVTYAHEHLVIDRGRPVAFPGLPPRRRRAAGVSWPRPRRAASARRRRDARRLRTEPGQARGASPPVRRPVVAATGLHLERFYGPSHWSLAAGRGRARGAVPSRTSRRASTSATTAGRSSAGRSSRRRHEGRRQRRRAVGPRPPIFARPRRPTGGPASRSHPLRGRHGRPGAGPASGRRTACRPGIALSHVDKVVDRGYHRELLSTGALPSTTSRSAGATRRTGRCR